VHARRLTAFLLMTASAGALAAAAAFAAPSGSGHATAKPKRGGSITIARQEDSQSFDKTNVFQNESIWLVEQINESLVTSTPDGRRVRPWLATSYKACNGGKR